MPRRRVFNFHDDPGHGWLEVKFTTLRNHGWKPGDFTAYSYVDEDKGVAYLEQDVDAATLLRWYDENGMAFGLRENIWRDYAPIRNLLPLCPAWKQWPDRLLPHLEAEVKAMDDPKSPKGSRMRPEAVSFQANKELRRQLWELRKQRGLKPVQPGDYRLIKTWDRVIFEDEDNNEQEDET